MSQHLPFSLVLLIYIYIYTARCNITYIWSFFGSTMTLMRAGTLQNTSNPSGHLNISWRTPARSDAARAVRAAAAVASNAVQFHRGLTATLAHVQLGSWHFLEPMIGAVLFDVQFKLDYQRSFRSHESVGSTIIWTILDPLIIGNGVCIQQQFNQSA